MAALAALVGLAVTTVYVLFAGPTFHWLDSGELVASAATLGVAHPPGHPLHVLLAKAFCFLPVGTIAFRVTLASALEAGAATAVTCLLCHEIGRRLWPGAGSRRANATASAAAALLLGLSYALWLQAVRAEVYALNLLVLVTGVLLLVRWDRDGDRRYVLLAALVGGLGLGNHHFLVLLALPAALLFLVLALRRHPGARRGWRLAGGIVASGGLGLTVLLSLPLRAARAPLVDWGHPTTLERLGWLLSAKAFQKSVSRAATESLEHRALGGLFTIFRGIAWDSLLGPLVFFAAVLGLYLLLRRSGTRGLGILLAGLVALNLLSPVLVGLDPYNPDAYGYLCVAVAFLAPAVAVALGALVQGLARPIGAGRAAALVGLAIVALLGWQVSQNLPQADLRGRWAAEETGRQQGDVPPGAVLLTSFFETVFNHWALAATTDLRPDLVWLHRNFLATPGYVEQLKARGHPLARLAARWRAAGHVLPKDLERLGTVLVELDMNIRPELATRLQPQGLTQRFGAPRPDDLRQHRRRIARWEHLIDGELGRDNEARRAALWTHYILARFCCARGLSALYRFHLERALRLAPHDRTLQRLRGRCQS